VLYDKKERTFPFRWKAGHMTVLKGPNGRRQQVDVAQRNAINDRGQIAATLVIAGQRQAVRWSPGGKAARLPLSPGTRGPTLSASTMTASSLAGRESWPTTTERRIP
jgi:uncharacterized membrane protein